MRQLLLLNWHVLVPPCFVCCWWSACVYKLGAPRRSKPRTDGDGSFDASISGCCLLGLGLVMPLISNANNSHTITRRQTSQLQWNEINWKKYQRSISYLWLDFYSLVFPWYNNYRIRPFYSTVCNCCCYYWLQLLILVLVVVVVIDTVAGGGDGVLHQLFLLPQQEEKLQLSLGSIWHLNLNC